MEACRETCSLDRYDVLVVDDDESNCELIGYILECELGVCTIRAADGRAAVRLAQECTPALILLDLWLPGLGGLEVARLLRAIPETQYTPIVAITAACVPPTRAYEAGCNDFIEKPFDLDVLLSKVRRHLPPPQQVGAA